VINNIKIDLLADAHFLTVVYGHMKICQENPDLVKIRQKYWTVYVKTEVHFTVAVDIKSPYNCCV
jgi:hypothetical protein